MSERRDTTHECPAPDCDRLVPQIMYACPQHWFALPKGIRDEIWRAYRREPLSDAHLAAMAAGATWYAENLR